MNDGHVGVLSLGKKGVFASQKSLWFKDEVVNPKHRVQPELLGAVAGL
jgi:hypothetical protein